MDLVSARLLDNGFRLLGLVMIATIICFLVTPIFVTVLMAFDSREYLGPLPPPSLSLRWFSRFFSDDYFLRGLATSVELALISVAASLSVGVATAVALERTNFTGKDALIYAQSALEKESSEPERLEVFWKNARRFFEEYEPKP